MSTCNPADEKMLRWLSHVGLLNQTRATGSFFFKKSAATRNAPVPPGVWQVTLRPLAAAS